MLRPKSWAIVTNWQRLGAGAPIQSATHPCLAPCRPGLRADFVILDSDIRKGLEPGMPLPGVLATFVDGRCEYGCQHFV